MPKSVTTEAKRWMLSLIDEEIADIDHMTPEPGEPEKSFETRRMNWKAALRALRFRVMRES